MYRGNEEVVTSIGAKATLVSNVKTLGDTVYWAVKSVFDNFDTFRRLHSSFANPTKEEMFEGNIAPLHPSAEKHFQEVGLVQ